MELHKKKIKTSATVSNFFYLFEDNKSNGKKENKPKVWFGNWEKLK